MTRGDYPRVAPTYRRLREEADKRGLTRDALVRLFDPYIVQRMFDPAFDNTEAFWGTTIEQYSLWLQENRDDLHRRGFTLWGDIKDIPYIVRSDPLKLMAPRPPTLPATRTTTPLTYAEFAREARKRGLDAPALAKAVEWAVPYPDRLAASKQVFDLAKLSQHANDGVPWKPFHDLYHRWKNPVRVAGGCLECGRAIPGRKDRVYCSAACGRKVRRRQNAGPAPAVRVAEAAKHKGLTVTREPSTGIDPSHRKMTAIRGEGTKRKQPAQPAIGDDDERE